MEKEKILQLVATALGDARQATVIVLTTDNVLTDREPVPVMSEPSPACDLFEPQHTFRKRDTVARKQTRSLLLSLWYKDNMMGSFYYYISEAKYEVIEVNGMKVLGNVAEIFDNWLMSMPSTSRAKQCKQGESKS